MKGVKKIDFLMLPVTCINNDNVLSSGYTVQRQTEQKQLLVDNDIHDLRSKLKG